MRLCFWRDDLYLQFQDEGSCGPASRAYDDAETEAGVSRIFQLLSGRKNNRIS